VTDATPPGWYPDPDGEVRWWNGTAWADPPTEDQGHQPSPSSDTGSASDDDNAETPTPPESNTGCFVVFGLIVAVILAFTLTSGGEDEDDGGDRTSPTAAACRRVSSLAADVGDQSLIDPEEFHRRAVEIRDLAAAGPDGDVEDGADHAVSRAATGEVSMSALDPVAQACIDGGYGPR